MDEMEMLFSSLSPEEMEELIREIDAPCDKELSSRIKSRLGIKGKGKLKLFTPKRILPVAAVLCAVIASAVAFTLSNTNNPEVTAPASETTIVVSPVDNPLMLAISSGDDSLVAKLLSLPGLISKETLGFAMNFSDLLSYETLHEIALSAKEALGSTGLDSLVESALFGDSERALEELKKREGMLMTPLEKLAFFFAVAFCDSEVVDEFVSMGYDVNSRDSKGNSIYAIAEKYGNEDNMKYAIEKGISN